MLVRGDVAATALAASKSFRHAAPGSDTWYLAAALTGSAAPYSGQLELARFVAEGLAAAWRDDVIDDRLVRAATPIVSGLIACGARHLAAPLVKRLFAIDIGEGVAGTWVLQARAFVEADRGDHAAAARYYLAASERLTRSGELASATAQLSNGADELMKCGAWRQAHEVMQRVDRTQLPGKLELVLDEFDGLALAHLGRLEEGVAIADNAFRVWNVPFIRGQILARFVAPLAPIDAPRALAVADEAVTALAPHALHLPSALATRSRVRRRVGDGDGARSDAEAAWAALIERASLRRPAIIRLAFIDELLARGETARAAALTLDARAALRTAAAQISDPALAQSFLDAVPEHAETMARAAVIDATTPGG
ncbi:MAG: hypothetical protein U1F43_09675 [Myxococcota bacterium]